MTCNFSKTGNWKIFYHFFTYRRIIQPENRGSKGAHCDREHEHCNIDDASTYTGFSHNVHPWKQIFCRQSISRKRSFLNEATSFFSTLALSSSLGGVKAALYENMTFSYAPKHNAISWFIYVENNSDPREENWLLNRVQKNFLLSNY